MTEPGGRTGQLRHTIFRKLLQRNFQPRGFAVAKRHHYDGGRLPRHRNHERIMVAAEPNEIAEQGFAVSLFVAVQQRVIGQSDGLRFLADNAREISLCDFT